MDQEQFVEKLLQIIAGNIEAMNLLRHEMEALKNEVAALKDKQNLSGYGSLLRGQVTTGLIAPICQHEYPPLAPNQLQIFQTCKKCGTANSMQIAINMSSNSSMPNMQELLDDLSLMMDTKK